MSLSALSRPASPPPAAPRPDALAAARSRTPGPDRSRTDTVEFRIPLGESGVRPVALREGSTLHDLLLIERSHLPAQRRRVLERRGRILHQEISVRTALAPGGRLLALAGQAQTVAVGADGGRFELRELAFMSDLRALVIARGSVFLEFARRGRPQIVTRSGSLADGLAVQRDRKTLLRAGLLDPLDFLRRLGGRQARGIIEGFKRIRTALGALQSAVAGIREPGRFNPLGAASADPAVAAAIAVTLDASAGTTRIEVLELAQAQVVASDEGISESPGLSGTFTLNGVAVEVTAGDTVYDIVRAVNQGTDPDGDGIMTGGSAQSRVRASFSLGRLRLESLDEGPLDIRVTDPDGVLDALGILETVSGETRFKNELVAPREALLEAGGAFIRSDTNTVEGAIGGVRLKLTGLGQTEITVANDPQPVVERLQGFVEVYNAALEGLNLNLIRPPPAEGERGAASSTDGLAARDPAVQGIRIRLERDVTDPVPGQPEGVDRAEDVGLSARRARRFTFAQDTLAAIARDLRAGLFSQPLKRAQQIPTVFNALDEIGITQRADGTLVLDEETFAGVLRERPGDVDALFTREEVGISRRLEATLAQVLDEKAGVLALRTEALNALDERLRSTFSRAFQRTLNAEHLSRLLVFA